MDKNNIRIEWVDIAKCLCIITVIFSHSDFTNSTISRFYVPFFLNVFFFCSGYTYRIKNNFKDYFKRKIETLMVPWIIYGLFNIFLSALISFNNHADIKEELIWFILQIRGKNDKLWFLSTLFLASILLYFVIEYISKALDTKHSLTKVIVVIGILGIISNLYLVLINSDIYPWQSAHLPWHIELLMPYLFMMLLGYAFRSFYENYFDKINTYKYILVMLLTYVILIIVKGMIFNNEIVNVFINFVIQVIGVFLIVAICKKMRMNKCIAFIGQNSIIYYALHGKVLSILQTVLNKVIGYRYELVLNNVALSILTGLMIVLLILIILIIPILFINRFLPFTIGKKRVVKKEC